MNEKQLASESVRKFSERYPQKRGQFFHVSNERNNQTQVWEARAIGIFPGVSDFLYFEGLFYPHPDKFMLVGIEIKVLGTRHERSRIEQQVEWGKTLEAQGGVWRLCTNSEDVVSCTEMNFKGLTISDVELILKTQKTKTILF